MALEDANGRYQDVVLRQPKRTAVLAYLMLRNGGDQVRRDLLLATFWPDVGAHNAKASLRQTLYFLRQHLGPDLFLPLGRHEVGISPRAIRCDALQFEEFLREGRPEDALRLYRGDLMEGFFIDGCHEFESWLDRRRNLLRRRAGEGAWALAAGKAAQGEVGEASYWAKRALALSDYTEPDVQRVMDFLDGIGDREGALRAFKGLETVLAQEFQARPSPETQALARRIKERDRPLAQGSFSSQGRRSGRERRSGDSRRKTSEPLRGPERRTEEDRRSGKDRRCGGDRRGRG